jgi:hypothetical protein
MARVEGQRAAKRALAACAIAARRCRRAKIVKKAFERGRVAGDRVRATVSLANHPPVIGRPPLS